MSQSALNLPESKHDRAAPSELDATSERHPTIPRLIIVKIDAQRRGVYYSARAMAVFDSAVHQARALALFGSRDGEVSAKPEGLLLRDGTSLITDPTPLDRNPYIVDVVDGRLVLTDAGRVIEEVAYWPKPKYYGKRTSSVSAVTRLLRAPGSRRASGPATPSAQY